MNLTRGDLIQKCTACNGTGSIEDPPSNANQGSYGVRRVSMQWQRSCTACQQTGEVLTPMGEAIADVVAILSRQRRL